MLESPFLPPDMRLCDRFHHARSAQPFEKSDGLIAAGLGGDQEIGEQTQQVRGRVLLELGYRWTAAVL